MTFGVIGAVDPDLINITSQRVPFFQAFSTVTLEVKISHDYTAMGASQVVLVVKNPQANAGDLRDTGSIPELRKIPWRSHGNPLLYSCSDKFPGTLGK